MDLQASRIETLTAEILILKQQTAVNIIEIGRRLIEVKESLPHGAWGKWLEERVEFSERTAQNFMRVAREFSKTQAIADLAPSKVFALLDVPANLREEFVESHQLESMTTRQIKEEARRLREAEEARRVAEARAKQAEEEIARLEEENAELRQANRELVIPQKEIIEKVVEKEVVPPEARAAMSEVERLAAENKRLRFMLEAAKNIPETQLEMDAKVSTFAGRIREFLRNMAPLGYLGHEVLRSSVAAQREYENAIAALEKWCQDMRDAMVKPEASQIIDLEVD